MNGLIGILGFLTPVVVGTWAGTRGARPWSAFLLGWLATPLAGLAMALGLLTLVDTPFATIVAVEAPVASVFLGLLSGAIAAFLVHRRQAGPGGDAATPATGA